MARPLRLQYYAAFFREIYERYLGEEQDEQNIPAARELVQRPSLKRVESALGFVRC